MPHKHLEDGVGTVASVAFYIDLGDQFDADKLQAYPPGSVIVLPGNTPDFAGQDPVSTSAEVLWASNIWTPMTIRVSKIAGGFSELRSGCKPRETCREQ